MGFKKAKAEQAALKVCMYGATGAGKTLTALMVGEGLASLAGGRVAMVDTERGTDFYCQEVPERAVHPAAFDFDRVETRSLMEALKACRESDPRTHPVVIIDSVTHLWEAARAAYTGKTTRQGSIPMQAWAGIKRPWKELMAWMLNTPQHVLLCGRQGNDWAESDSGELVNCGYKLKAEGETAYEPHVLLRLEAVRGKGGTVHVAHVEKDRTGKLPRLVEHPSFDTLARPLLGLLGRTQARMQTEEDAAALDHEELGRQQRERENASGIVRERLLARLGKAKTLKEARAVGQEIAAEKASMLTPDLEAVRNCFREMAARLAPAAVLPGPAPDPAEPEERKAIQESGGG